MLKLFLERFKRIPREPVPVPEPIEAPPTVSDCGHPDYHAVDGRNLDNYFEQVRQMCEPLANPFCYYEALLDEIARLPNLRIVTVRELARNSRPDSALVCLRHDIDSDPITALRIARHLARIGESGSFYLLHTAPYYAEPVSPGVVVRNPQLVEWIRGFIVSGCEVGLHCDAFGICQNWGMDGIGGVKAELAWLRSQGLALVGTVAHNSGPTYGAENYEIFSERVLWQRVVHTDSGLELPLGQVSMASLGIEYDGTFAVARDETNIYEAAAFFADTESADIRSESWMRRYLVENPACRWTIDAQCWLLGKDRWAIAGYSPGVPDFIWDAQLEDVIAFLAGLPAGSRVMMVTHPEYVSG